MMNVRLTLGLLVGTALIFASSARATGIRSGSPYGIPSSCSTLSIETQCLVPLTPINPSDVDLVLQISPTSSDLGDSLQVTLDLSSTSFVTGTDAFGILNCPGFNLGATCTPTTNPTCDLTGVTDVAGTITLPGSCDVANETLYFDLASTAGISVSPVTPTATPEPGSLALLGIAVIPVMLLSRRRL